MLLAILTSGMFIIGCGPSDTPVPAGPATPRPSAPMPPAASVVAEAGGPVFASRCSVCHGTNGEGSRGPAVIGTTASLEKYGTAQGLLDYVSDNMPKTNPGSLSRQEYLNIVSFLLVRNNYLPEDAAFVESQLINVTLK